MCGIAGIVNKSSPVREEELQMMAGKLQHRGPDNTGYYMHEKVGLAHTRLSIIDLESGDQPILSLDGTLALAANGEIYNYVELRKDLVQEGCRFKTRSDSETILHAYASSGAYFVERLHGMFAFALFDRPSKKLLLARDRLGIKPLFYTISPDRVAFASEIKALLPILHHAPEINPEALSQFFHNQFNTGKETIIKGIHRVLPGEVIIIDKELGISHRQYWTPLATVPRDITLEEAQEKFEPLFEQVMREHIRSDVPYGLFLSGGVDSAVVLAMLHRFQERPIRTFSVGFKDSSMEDELEPARFIANQFNTDHEPITLDRDLLFHRLPYVIWATDDLMRDYACLPTSFLAEEAAKELKVVFTGEGGDEVFAGYGRYKKSPVEKWLKNLLAPGSGGFRTRSQIKPRWTRGLFASQLREHHDDFRKPFLHAWQSCPATWSDVKKSQYVDMVTALPDNLLVKVDRMLMSFGVEGRVPFLDHRIVDFGLSLPDHLKIKSHYGKLFLRRWAEKHVPKNHLWRKKTGFHVPVGDYLSKRFLHDLEAKLLRNDAVKTWFNPATLKTLFHFQRRGGHGTRAIWCLMQFAIWHHIFIQGDGTEQTPME
ncbi:MAG: asparagine synthase (glutamine-hydrolyzing), partial [Deltaproteobacteria bacterium]|nr:asparagine synthase (glutamine-hydrolyzing) [Deltaproteobacteria bacterium]